jgi:hypothetical protein
MYQGYCTIRRGYKRQSLEVSDAERLKGLEDDNPRSRSSSPEALRGKRGAEDIIAAVGEAWHINGPRLISRWLISFIRRLDPGGAIRNQRGID